MNTPPRTCSIPVILTVACLAVLSALAPPAALAADLPDHIVNGDFEAYTRQALMGGNKSDWTAIEPATGLSYNNGTSDSWGGQIAGWDRARFAWQSDQQDGGGEQRAGAVELQFEENTGNIYAEITAAQAGTAVYQDIDTLHDMDAVYEVRLKHASITRTWVDKMQVVVGAPGREKPVPMTRVTSNGNGDRVGETSDVVATVVSNEPMECADGAAMIQCTARNHKGQWEEYVGRVTVPAHTPVTRFSFRNVSSSRFNYGNLVDDIGFTIAYPLVYDPNGGMGALPGE